MGCQICHGNADYDSMKKKRSSLGCLFWIALILLVLVVFIFNRKKIDEVVKSTGLLDQLRKERPQRDEPEIKRIEIPLLNPEEPKKSPDPPAKPAEPAVPKETVEVKIDPPIETPQEGPKETQKKMRKSNLYFIQVDDEGGIQLRRVSRTVYFTDSPLTETMKSLIEGMLPEEIAKGYLSLIPENTKLLSITIKDDTAFMNFNESFKYNPFGNEGHLAQLKQIVYTATEFPTVKKVQFLIEGAGVTYLSPEGLNISKPLGRDSF